CGAARQQPTTTTPPPQQQSSSSSITITKRSRVSTINQFKSSCHRTPAATPKSAQTQKPLSIKEEFSLYISTNRSSKDFETYWNEKQNLLPILSSFRKKFNLKENELYIVVPCTTKPDLATVINAEFNFKNKLGGLDSEIVTIFRDVLLSHIYPPNFVNST
ncbi:unnamed protein product, partial [Didymodactylos carnosus]